MKSNGVERNRRTGRLRTFWSGNNRIRLMLTLELAVMLPAAALIYVNFYQLKSIERDKVLEAAIHRDFQQMLAISEKQMNMKAYAKIEDARDAFPPPDADKGVKAERLDLLLSQRPWLAHAFLFDAEKGFVFRSQPQRMREPFFLQEHQVLEKQLGWLAFEAKTMLDALQKKSRQVSWYSEPAKRPGGYAFRTSALFPLAHVSRKRVAMGGVIFEPDYLKKTFFPEMLEALIAYKLGEDGGNRLAMIVYPAEAGGEGGTSGLMYKDEPLAASAGWTEGKPEISTKRSAGWRWASSSRGRAWRHSGGAGCGTVSSSSGCCRCCCLAAWS